MMVSLLGRCAYTFGDRVYSSGGNSGKKRKNGFYINKLVWRWSMRPLFLSNFAVARFFERGDCAMFFCISLEIKVLCQLNGLLKATMFVPKWKKKIVTLLSF